MSKESPLSLQLAALVWLRSILKSVLESSCLALGAIFALFVAFSFIPGDAALIGAGMDGDDQLVAALRAEYGLDKSVLVRFGSWLLRALQGDLGVSTRYNQPVVNLVQHHAKTTFRLTLFSFSLTILFAFATASLVIVLKQQRFATWVAMISQVFLAIPQFWLALLVIQIFSVQLGWFHLFRLQLGWRDFFFPALVLAFMQSAYLSRYLIYAWRRELKQRYIMSGLARGLSAFRLRFIHALRGSLMPSVTVLALIWIDLLSGSIIIESLFALPGLGQLLISGVSARDVPLVQGITLYFMLVVLASNVVVQVLHGVLNPKLEAQVSDNADG
jgi:peptide/nickel transport system permease protein